MDDRFNFLVVLLQAYLNACKDFHYFCTNFSLHLLADEIMGDDLQDTIDGIKENVFIAEGKKPLSARKYAEGTAKATPETKDTDNANLKQLLELAKKVEGVANSLSSGRRAVNVLLDTVADNMAHAETLLNIELRKEAVNEDFESIKEYMEGLFEAAEEVIKVEHDHKANTEKPIDRAETTAKVVDYKKVGETVKDYEAQNLLVAEDLLDNLSKKLGI